MTRARSIHRLNIAHDMQAKKWDPWRGAPLDVLFLQPLDFSNVTPRKRPRVHYPRFAKYCPNPTLQKYSLLLQPRRCMRFAADGKTKIALELFLIFQLYFKAIPRQVLCKFNGRASINIPAELEITRKMTFVEFHVTQLAHF